jgi:hypothetical protein
LVNLRFKSVKALINVVSNAFNFSFSDGITSDLLTSLVQQDRNPRKLSKLLMRYVSKKTGKQRQATSPNICHFHAQHFQALKDLLIRLFGSFAVFADVNFFFIPDIRAQKESLRFPPSGWGAFKFMPCAFAEARPLAFNPPLGLFPSFLCHAGDLAI